MSVIRRAADPQLRRRQGELESTVMNVLLSAGEALNAAQVRERLVDRRHNRLAYTTVVTILGRLHEKDLVSRARDGRAYRYTPVADQAGLAARRLSAVLDDATDRDAVLTRFVSHLSDHDEELLRQLLQGPEGTRE